LFLTPYGFEWAYLLANTTAITQCDVDLGAFNQRDSWTTIVFSAYAAFVALK